MKSSAISTTTIKQGLNEYRLEMTCSQCPEQYDVYLGDEQIGYLRLRHGCFTASYPDVNGLQVYEADNLEGDGMFGEGERQFYLGKAVEALADAHIFGRLSLDVKIEMAYAQACDDESEDDPMVRPKISMLLFVLMELYRRIQELEEGKATRGDGECDGI